MNYIEEHGKKVAAVLCVASCFPVVAAVYAMETEPGWHGDRYINSDATVAKGWQEIEGKSYYFDEKGEVDKETTKEATVATVSNTVSESVQTNVTTTAKEVVQEEVKVVEEQKKAEEAQAAQEALEEQNQAVVEETTPVVEEEVQEPVEQAPVQEVVDQPVQDQAPVQDSTVESAPEQTPSQPSAPEQTPAPSDPVQEPSQPSTPEQTPSEPSQPVQPSNPGTTNQYADLNNRIAAAAQTLVGVTDGQQCTQVVQQALALAGVSDAYQLWPDEYIYYGYYTDTPQAGNLVYYNNGGRGVDHIAIYIGNGLCVHGNFWTADGVSQTIISSVYNGGGGSPQFIQVTR